jgi:general secretion pathway protein C
MDLSRFFPASPRDLQGWLSSRTVILLLMALFIYQGTGIFYKALALQFIRMRPAPATERPVPAAVRTARPPVSAYAVIPQRNIFGVTTKAVEDPKAAAALAQQAALAQPAVALTIDLRGTVAGDEKYGFAIVEEKASKKQQLVKVGDVISGAKVLRIKRNAIDLLVNNREQTLVVVETMEKPLASPAGRPPPPPARVAQPTGPIIVNRTELDEQLKDMGTLLSQAQARPYFHLGQPDGFIITNIRPGSLYQRLGIVNGDVIQGVNDQKITTADDVVGLFNALKDSDSISLTVKRRDSPITLNYQFR